jgi:hypothetical protein
MKKFEIYLNHEIHEIHLDDIDDRWNINHFDFDDFVANTFLIKLIFERLRD